jgi:peptide-methionine (S)-S-oxide reductase
MMKSRSVPTRRAALCVLAGAAMLWLGPPARGLAETATTLPPPALSENLPDGVVTEKVVLAGGCFWGVQAVFQHLNGVAKALSGYAGGSADTADYETVSTGRTGHAESVEITFDPRVVSLGTILQVYFSVAHDPTQLDRQGPDVGTQYRSEIFATTAQQKAVADAYIAQLGQAHAFARPIVTRTGMLQGFYPAEAYHQDYATLHPDSPYIAWNDLPKVENLQRMFPTLYRSKPMLVAQVATQ